MHPAVNNRDQKAPDNLQITVISIHEPFTQTSNVPDLRMGALTINSRNTPSRTSTAGKTNAID